MESVELYIHMYTHIYIYVYICGYMCVCTYMYVHTYTYMYIRVGVCVCCPWSQKELDMTERGSRQHDTFINFTACEDPIFTLFCAMLSCFSHVQLFVTP